MSNSTHIRWTADAEVRAFHVVTAIKEIAKFAEKDGKFEGVKFSAQVDEDGLTLVFGD